MPESRERKEGENPPIDLPPRAPANVTGQPTRPRLFSTVILVVLIGLLTYLIIIFVVGYPVFLRLWAEGTYQFEDAYVVNHFEIADPYRPNETMYASVALTSPKPAIMSHTDITATVNLFASDFWHTQFPENATIVNQTTATQPFVLIFSGADCRNETFEKFKLRDHTCIMPLFRNDLGNYYNNFPIQYQSAGDFPILLATNALFNDNVTRSEGQYIVVSAYESYISNSYAYASVILATASAAFAGVNIIIVIVFTNRARQNP